MIGSGGSCGIDWPARRLRFLARLNPSRSEVRDLPPATEVSFVPMEAVGEYGGLACDEVRPLESVYSGYTYFRDGDVVVAKITPCFENGKGALATGLAGGVAFGTTELHVLRPGPELDPRFLFYLTISQPFRDAGTAAMTGAAGQKRVPEEFLRDHLVSLPSKSTQRAIADFLDEKTATIDALIAKKERLIELIEEKRQAAITHLVTGGSSSTPMRDSGVMWIGEIPEHWTVSRYKFVLSHAVDCPHSTPEYDDSGDYPAIRTSDIERGRLDLYHARRVHRHVYLDRIARLTPRGNDIVYSREGERFGLAALVPEDTKVCLAQRVMLFRVADSHDARFMMWLLNSEVFYHQVRQDTLGATSPRINIPTILNAWIPVPPLAEQMIIGLEIEATTSRYDTLVTRVRQQIARLREYRQTLISAAVTGQIDTRRGVEVPA